MVEGLASRDGKPIPWLGLRELLVALLWLGIMKGALDHVAFWLPPAFAHRLTVDGYVILVQIPVTALGWLLAFVMVPRQARLLPLAPVQPKVLLRLLALAPTVFVLGLALGMLIALPTLLAEIAARGTQSARQDLGGLGNALLVSPLWETLLWGVVVSPIAEELLFRGALWSALQSLLAPREVASPSGQEPSDEEMLASVVQPSVVERGLRWLRAGTGATLISTAIFALMHNDTPGGVGIIRVVSAACFGLAAGSVRQVTGSLLATLFLHVIYNVISVGHTRGWWITASLPSHFGIPMAMLLVSLLGWLLVLVVALGGRLTQSRAR